MDKKVMKGFYIDFFGDSWRREVVKFVNNNYGTDYRTFDEVKNDFDVTLENRRSAGEDVYADICIYKK